MLNADTLRAAYDLLPKGGFAGLELRTMAVRIGPARLHARRSNGGKLSYHNRVQKKWVRRFGLADNTPLKRGEVYMIANRVVVVREDDMPRINALLREGAP